MIKIAKRKNTENKILNRNKHYKNSDILHVSVLDSGDLLFGFFGIGTYYNCNCKDLLFFLKNKNEIIRENKKYKDIIEKLKNAFFEYIDKNEENNAENKYKEIKEYIEKPDIY